MIVTLTESGGWTNVRRRCTVDTARLSPDVAARLEAGITTLLGAGISSTGDVRDAKLLVIEVADAESNGRVSFSEARPPAGIGPVMDILRPLCRPVANSLA